MSVKWISTNFKGVRYYEHPKRKHGIKKDRYFAIRYQINSKRVEEGLGWASEKDPKDGLHWSEEKAALILAELKGAAKTGHGSARLAEKRAAEKDRKEKEKVIQERLSREAITFDEIFTKYYFPIAKQNKSKGAYSAEENLFRLWLNPIIGSKPLHQISPILLERIKKNMTEANRAPRSINYALSVIRQVYNFSKSIGLYSGICPTEKVKIPKNDNRRQRFLTHEEAKLLLTELRKKSLDVHDMALLSLHCGLRASEVFCLTWADVDIAKGILTLRDTKSGKTRHAYTTKAVKAMLKTREKTRIDVMEAARNKSYNINVVFPAKKGIQISSVSNTFSRSVEDLQLNAGVDDRRHKVVFHTLRHTFASWLVESGVSLYTVQRLLGHESIRQTERYSHLSRDTLQDAVRILELGFDGAKKQANDIPEILAIVADELDSL